MSGLWHVGDFGNGYQRSILQTREIWGLALQIDGFPQLIFTDIEVHYNGRRIPYNCVQSIQFTATVTRHSINLIPAGKSYEASLRLLLPDGWLSIEPDKGMFGALKKKGFEALQKAFAILSTITFTSRVERYESQLAQHGYFEVSGFQLHRSGYIFRRGREICSISSPDISISLEPFRLIIAQKSSSAIGRVLSSLTSQEVQIPIDVDRDCVLYMLKHIYGLTFRDTPVPEKRLDRRKVFYQAVLRFGALLSKVDGRVDREELVELKRFFRLDEQHIPNAARIFNEELAANANISDILDEFASAFDGANEVKESFILGMLSVSLADGVLQRVELQLLRDAAVYLGLSAESFSRILLTAGIDPDLFLGADEDEDGGAGGGSGASRQTESSMRTTHLRVLGLDGAAGPNEIREAYKRLVKRYHPDVLRGQGMPEGEIEKAGRILARINMAYEALRRSV